MNRLTGRAGGAVRDPQHTERAILHRHPRHHLRQSRAHNRQGCAKALVSPCLAISLRNSWMAGGDAVRAGHLAVPRERWPRAGDYPVSWSPVAPSPGIRRLALARRNGKRDARDLAGFGFRIIAAVPASFSWRRTRLCRRSHRLVGHRGEGLSEAGSADAGLHGTMPAGAVGLKPGHSPGAVAVWDWLRHGPGLPPPGRASQARLCLLAAWLGSGPSGAMGPGPGPGPMARGRPWQPRAGQPTAASFSSVL